MLDEIASINEHNAYEEVPRQPGDRVLGVGTLRVPFSFFPPTGPSFYTRVCTGSSPTPGSLPVLPLHPVLYRDSSTNSQNSEIHTQVSRSINKFTLVVIGYYARNEMPM
ncbi:hypothetical protein HMI54_013397, partial [Coelomomyces lativittatus]